MTRFARELPPRPHLDHLRRQARRLQRAFGESDPEARQRVAESLPRRAEATSLYLADAQCVVAREYGFASWPKLKLHVEAAGDPMKLAVVAARLGHAERLRRLLNDHPDLIALPGEEGEYLLHQACHNVVRRNPRRLEVLATILDAGSAVDVALDDGQTPLHYAAGLGIFDICRFLLERGADPSRKDRYGGTPLHHALESGCHEVADVLASRGPVDDNLRTAAGLGRLDLVRHHFCDDGSLAPSAGASRAWSTMPWRPQHEPSSEPSAILAEALEYAVKNGRLEAAKELVRVGARFEAEAMRRAVISGREDFVELLLSNDPDLTVPVLWNFSIWQWANLQGHAELARRLKRMAAPRHLPTAADLGRLDLVEKLLEQGADPNATNHEGTTALGLALGVRSLMASPEDGGSPEVAKRLEAAGGNLDFASAAKLGRLDEVERHLAAGADPQSGLGAAITTRQHEVIDRLVAAGASLSIFDAAELGRTEQVLAQLTDDFDWESTQGHEDTLLYKAIWGGSCETVRALLERGAPVCFSGSREVSGRAAVHVAAWVGADPAIWDLLLEHGADINHGSDPGTPYDCARMANNTSTMALIVERGGLSARELGDYPHELR